MAIGDVRASGGLQAQLVSDRSSDIVAQATAGLGDTVNRLAQAGLSYLNSKTDIEAIYDRRAQSAISLDLNTKFVQYQQDRAKEFTEYSRARSANPLGMTREYDAMVAEREKEFLATVPERHREEMAARLAQDRAQRVGSAFTAELSLLDTQDTNTLNTGLNTIGSGLKAGSVSLEDAEAQWEEMVLGSGLDEATKQGFIESGKVTLQGLEFGTIVEQGALGYGAVNDGTTGDVAAAGLLPQQRGVLNAISSREAPGYNVWNGGTTFEGYEDHPAASGSYPGKSSAAGRYQFTLGTWQTASASYERTYGVKVPDFSPEWQDRVALHWAEVVFNRWNKEGLTFKEVLASGDPMQIVKIRRVLGNPKIASNPNSVEWEGWADRTFGGDAAKADAEWLALIMGEKGIAGGGTGPANMPNVWTDPRFANLPLDQKQSFANAAAAAAEQQKQAMATQMRLDRDKFLDTVYNAGYSGDPLVEEELKRSPYWDAEAQAKFNAGREVYQKSESGVAKVNAALAAGTPLTAVQMKDLGKWFGEDRFTGIINGDENAYAVLASVVERARIFPEGSVEVFRTALENPATKQTALEFLASAHAGDPTILKRSGFSDVDIADIQLYKNMAANSGSPEAALAGYTEAREAATRLGKTPEQLGNEASKLFNDKYKTADSIIDFFDGYFTFRPDTKLNERTEDALMLDASVAFQDGYKRTGTEAGAEAYMQTVLNDTWGVTATRSYTGGDTSRTNTSKNVLMKYPPEKYYADEYGDASFLYKRIADFAVANGASSDDAVLMADDVTEKEIRLGKPPTYKVIGRDENGGAVVLPGRFGGEVMRQEVEEGIFERAQERHARDAVGKFREIVLDLDRQIIAEELRPTGKLEELKAAKAEAEKNRDAAILSAVELGVMSPDMVEAESAIRPRVDELAAEYSKRLETDQVLQRSLATAANNLKLTDDPMEAERLVLVAFLARDLKISNEMAEVIALRIMETRDE